MLLNATQSAPDQVKVKSQILIPSKYFRDSPSIIPVPLRSAASASPFSIRVHDAGEEPWGFCRLCALLWARPRPSITQPDLKGWWGGQGACQGNALVTRLLKGSKDKT